MTSHADDGPVTAAEIRTLTTAIDELREQITHLVPRDEVERRAREQVRVRRRVAGTILVSVFLGTVLAFVGDNAAISRCYLHGDRAHPPVTRHNPVCNAMFPGYNEAADTNARNLKDFAVIIANVPENKARIADLQKQITVLKTHRAAR
jgi:uncharacterized small protein (DUF1192 family)